MARRKSTSGETPGEQAAPAKPAAVAKKTAAPRKSRAKPKPVASAEMPVPARKPRAAKTRLEPAAQTRPAAASERKPRKPRVTKAKSALPADAAIPVPAVHDLPIELPLQDAEPIPVPEPFPQAPLLEYIDKPRVIPEPEVQRVSIFSMNPRPKLPQFDAQPLIEETGTGEDDFPVPPPSAPGAIEPVSKKWRERLGQYWLLVRGHRPIGTLLLLWPTWWALWLAADGFPSISNWLIFTLGVWLTRSAGCVINDYADRWLDPHVERTKARPLATGAVSGREALGVFAVLMLAAFVLVLFTNTLTVELSVVGVFLAASYPYLKRYTYLPQVYLGLAFGWGIPMAFAATKGSVPPLAWLLFIANVVWATAYDTWYAMVDREDDLRVGAKSTAILFGEADLIAQGVLYALFIAALVFVGLRADPPLAPAFFFALVIAAGLIAWEFKLARGRDRDGCFRAFLHNNWVGVTVFVGIVLGTSMR